MRSLFTSRSFAALTIVVIAAALLVAVWDRHGAGIAAQGTPSCVTPPSGLRNWWPGDGNTIDIADSANGTLFNGATFTSGKVGQAFSFDGVDDYVKYGADCFVVSDSCPGNFGTANFTVDFWIKTTSTRYEGVIGRRPSCTHGSFWDLRMGGGFLFLELDQDPVGTNYNNMGTNRTINDGNFHHVALVRQGVTASIYIDGVLAGANSTSGITNISHTGALIAGRSACTGAADGTQSFTGQLDELEIFNRALAVSEIQSIFNAGSAGKCKPDADSDGVTDALDTCPGTPVGTVVDESGCPVIPCPPLATGWNFSERFNGAFDNTWAAPPGALPNAFGITYIGAPSYTFQSIQGRQTLRMTNTLNDRQRVGFVTNPVLPGATGRLEARINTLIQDSTRIDGLFELWLVNATDSSKWVRATLFGSNFSAQRRWDVESSLGNYFAVQVNYANNTWYRLRIDAFPGSLRASLWNDSGTVQIASYTFTHDLAALGSNFRVGISQWMGIPGSPFITDVAVDYVRASPAVVANAGSDQTVECQGAQTTVTLNGAASCDPDGDPLTFTWREGSTLLGTGQTLPVNLGLGSHTITLTVTDPSGASSQDTVIINVVDTTPPQVTPPANASYQCLSQVPPGNPSQATATDNCSAPTITVAEASNGGAGSTVSPLIITRYFTATDAAGNSASAYQTITVIDNTPPVPNLAALPDVAGQCSAAISAAPTATDNCRGSVTGTTSDPLSYNSQGTFIVTWTFDDGNGNRSTQTQRVIVRDTIAPVPDVAALPDVTGQCSATISAAPTATDNCRGSVTGTTNDPLSYSSQGTFIVTWTFDDGNGNTSTHTQRVIVKDTTAPAITTSNKTVNTDPNLCSAVVAHGTTASDNCALASLAGVRSDGAALTAPYPKGTTTINWTATDQAGNTSTATQTITVIDNIPPVITACATNKTVSVNAACQGAIPNLTGEVGATDNCTASSALTITQAPAAGTLVGLGATPVTITVKDATGNMSTCAVTVNVVDATPPTVASSVTDPSLWPPNHNLINVGLAVSRTDNCTSNSTVQVLVYSDEDDEEETGDGNHSPDAKDLAPGSLRLRSERKGDGDGRVYLIVVKVTDAAGNVGFACSTVVVPKSQSQANKDAVNAQAAAAKAYFQSNGAPPSGYFVVGDGPVIGPKQ